MASETRLDAFVRGIKENWILLPLLFIAIAVVMIGKFMGAIDSVCSVLPRRAAADLKLLEEPEIVSTEVSLAEGSVPGLHPESKETAARQHRTAGPVG